jgi:hypothetical protein
VSGRCWIQTPVRVIPAWTDASCIFGNKSSLHTLRKGFNYRNWSQHLVSFTKINRNHNELETAKKLTVRFLWQVSNTCLFTGTEAGYLVDRVRKQVQAAKTSLLRLRRRAYHKGLFKITKAGQSPYIQQSGRAWGRRGGFSDYCDSAFRRFCLFSLLYRSGIACALNITRSQSTKHSQENAIKCACAEKVKWLCQTEERVLTAAIDDCMCDVERPRRDDESFPRYFSKPDLHRNRENTNSWNRNSLPYQCKQDGWQVTPNNKTHKNDKPRREDGCNFTIYIQIHDI